MEPLTPQSLCDGPSPDMLKLARLDIKRLRKTIQYERTVNAKIEHLLIRANDQLESQIADLRSAIFANLVTGLSTTEKS